MTAPDPREPLARIVHQVRLDHETERAAAEGRATFLLGAYEDRSEHQRELDMRIGAAVAAAAVAGAEGKLGAIRELCLDIEPGCPRAKFIAAVDRILEIVGTEEENA